jgi:hypothetical protein
MPQPLYPWKRSAGTHWIGGWVDVITGLDAVTKKKETLTLTEIEAQSCS